MQVKSLLCAIARNENRYLKEWIDYHYNLGFDKIIIFDNNDTEFIPFDNVEIINYRGKHISNPKENMFCYPSNGIQEEAYNDCYFNHSNNYDWIAYLDIDEFLVLDNDLKVNEFLSQDIFKDIDAIQINWEMYDDNDRIYYENIPVNERFTRVSKKQYCHCKTIVKTNLPNFVSLKMHYAEIRNGRYVYPNGEKTYPGISQSINYEGARIKHFYTKTIDEFADRKFNQLDVSGRDYFNEPEIRIKNFFLHNKVTPEKIKVIEDKLNAKVDIIETSNNTYKVIIH